MERIIVKNREVLAGGKVYRCAIGASGVTADKREGDGKTPLGIFPFRECWYRADRIAAPATQLPLRIIRPDDGWCDDAAHPAYNTHVKLPFAAHHEKLWRDDHVYDLVIPLGYNDGPIIPGHGSAIFMHLARARPHSSSEAIVQQEYEGTEGCVALAAEDFLELLPHLTPKMQIEIIS